MSISARVDPNWPLSGCSTNAVACHACVCACLCVPAFCSSSNLTELVKAVRLLAAMSASQRESDDLLGAAQKLALATAGLLNTAQPENVENRSGQPVQLYWNMLEAPNRLASHYIAYVRTYVRMWWFWYFLLK